MGDMNNKQNLANCPNAFKVTLDKPCEICGRIRMIRSDIGICIPCIQKEKQNRGWQTGSVWYNTNMTNNNANKGNKMIHDDFDTQIQSDEDFRAGITDEEWHEMQDLGIDGIDDEDFGDDEMFRLGDEMFRFDVINEAEINKQREIDTICCFDFDENLWKTQHR